jgi:mycothiol synthase
MRRHLHDLPAVSVPPGYALRSLTPEDMAEWTSLLARNGELGEWGIDRARPLFAPDSPMPLSGSFFVTKDGHAVATAQLHLQLGDSPYRPIPELGWVAVLPGHRGHRLGEAVCLAVLHYARGHGHQSVYLCTDDFRLPAIRTYLRLEFEPWMYDPTAPDRWAAVYRLLNAGGDRGGNPAGDVQNHA